MAAFFWHSDKSTDDDKRLLDWRLNGIETVLNRKDEYNESQTELAIIRLRLTLDDIDLYKRSHPDLWTDYLNAPNRKIGYRHWLQKYISENAATEFHIIGDSKPLKKYVEMMKQDHVRES